MAERQSSGQGMLLQTRLWQGYRKTPCASPPSSATVAPRAQAVATALRAHGSVACEFNGEIGTSTSKWSRALVLELAGTSLFAANRLAIEALRACCLDVSRPGDALAAYRPHLSLAYGDCSLSLIHI